MSAPASIYYQFMHLLVEYSPDIVAGWEAREKERMLNKNRGMLF